MKLLFDLFPLVLFFIAYKFADIYTATAVAMAAGVAQIIWLAVRKKPIEPMHWVNLAIIVVFGGATLWLHDETFIKWKPTVLYWGFALALGIAQFGMGKNPIRGMLGKQISLPQAAWNKLNSAWAVFFAFVGALNLYVAYNWPTETWVSFKVFGIFGLLIAFVIAQSVFLGRHMQPEAANDDVAVPANDRDGTR